MNVLFLTHSRLDKQIYGDASTRYRCFNLAEVLRENNHQANVQSLAELKLSDVRKYDIVSCLRPVICRKIQQITSLCKRHGIHLVADFDDLIFDPDMARQSPMVINGFAETPYVRSQFLKHAQAMSLFDEMTVSTPALYKAATACFPRIRIAIIRNGLSSYWVQHARHVCLKTPDRFRLSYLPGSRSHDHDLAMISPCLSRFLMQHPAAQLSLVGKIGLPDSALPMNQVVTRPWMDYFDLPTVISDCNATLAPLRFNVFNYAKSHIKFIESAALGVPAVCSPTSDLEEHSVDGLLLVKHLEGWDAALQSILDPDYRQAHQQGLMDYALDNCTAQSYSTEVLTAWDNNSYWSNRPTASAA